MVTVALIAILANVAYSSYQNYIEEAKINRALKELALIQVQIDAYAFNNNDTYPMSLSELNLDGMTDPWGNAYRYLNIAQTGNVGQARKDRNLVPINSDYDLYSMGPDGRSASAFTSQLSQDDLVRGNNGSFLGVAEDY